jgi:hypothetical protein
MRATASALPLLLAGCLGSAWHDVPALDTSGSPCFRADIVDGVSETDPAELTALYDCLNIRGGFEPLGGIVDAVATTDTRAGKPAALEVAAVVNRFASEADVVSGLRTATHLLQEEDRFLLHVVHTVAEWAYGAPWPDVEAAFEGGGPNPYLAPGSTDDGLFGPLLRMASVAAGTTLDEGTGEAFAASLGALAQMPELADAFDTLSRLVGDQEAGRFAHVADDSAAYFRAAIDPEGHDTLVAFATALVEPRAALSGLPPLLAMQAPLLSVLDDDDARLALNEALGGLYRDELLDVLPAQLHSLVTIDSDGGFVSAGEPSAQEDLIRLLDVADRDVDCVLLHVDSLSVFLLETIAGFPPDSVALLIELTADLVDEITLLGTLACEGVSPQIVPLLPSLVRLAESGALRSLIPVLAALRDGGHVSRVPEIVTLLAALSRGEVLPSFAAHVRRELDEPLIGHVLAILGAYVDPQDGQAQGDIDTIWRILAAVVRPPPGEGPARSLLGLSSGPLRAVLADPIRVSEFLLRWAVLLDADGSESHGFLSEFAPLLAVDPELDFLALTGRLVSDPYVNLPVLRIVESTVLLDVFLGRGPDGNEGPVGMIARFAADGSLERLLGILVWVADTLDSVGLLDEDMEE